MLITNEQINQVTQIIAKNCNPDKIILFGSYAEGMSNKDSDLDIAVIKETDTPNYLRSSEIRKYLRGMLIPMDIVVYTQPEIEEWKDVKQAFITQILQTGKVVYEKK